MQLLGCRVALFLTSWEISILFPEWLYQLIFLSTVYEGSPFSSPLPTSVVSWLVNFSHSDPCEVVSHCGFDLYFPDAKWCGALVHMSVGHLDVFFAETPVHIFCPFFTWLFVFWVSSLVSSLWPSNCTTGYLPQRYRCSEMKGHMHPNVHSSNVHNIQTVAGAKCSLTDEWIKKIWSIYTMEYYSAMKRNEILPFATTGIDLEGIMLSEKSQRKTKTIWSHLYVEFKD